MAERTSAEQRIDFYRCHVQGKSYAEIAAAQNVSVECVRYWCRKQSKGQGVKSQWHIPGRGALSQFAVTVRERVGDLRAQHPRWGPISIRLHLDDEKDLKGKRLPSAASIGRWLHEDPKNRRLPKPKQPPAQVLDHVHQRWEIDFKVKIHLQGGKTVQLHSVTDPFSAAYIGAYVYVSEPNTSRVPLQDVQTTLRACFSEWRTLPEEIQTDGESVLAVRGDLPTDFSLWLAGLGVQHRIIPAGRPTVNGSVERAHRTTNDYCLCGNLQRSPQELQLELNQARDELNHRYPSRAKGCGGKPPLSAHPELLSPRREYLPQQEEWRFDPNQVDALLSGYKVLRKVGKTGQITIRGEDERYCVGRQWARKFVEIHFDPASREYVAYALLDDGQRQEVKRWPARNLDAHHLLWPGEPALLPYPQQLGFPFAVDFFSQAKVKR